METEQEKHIPICQSCGMAIAASEHFGTNADLSMNEDYCCFCLQSGDFTDNMSMNEAIEANLNDFITSENTKGSMLTKNEAVLKMGLLFSTFKRWKSHTTTHQHYFKAINQSIEYINLHLDEEIYLQDLAELTHISGFHFHRIFKSMLGESVGEFIKRLRLEKAMFKLQTTNLTISCIAEKTGYQTSYALSKAFKKHYGISPGSVRSMPVELLSPLEQIIDKMELKPEIKEVGEKEVLCVSVRKPFDDSNAFVSAWSSLTKQAGVDGIPNEQTEYLSYTEDISTITHPSQCRVYIGVTNIHKIKPKGKYCIKTIMGGLYAIFIHKGSHKELEKIYCNIYRYWIPNSRYKLRDIAFFEKYVNSPDNTSKNELLTEIYIPISI